MIQSMQALGGRGEAPLFGLGCQGKIPKKEVSVGPGGGRRGQESRRWGTGRFLLTLLGIIGASGKQGGQLFGAPISASGRRG